MSGIAKGLDMGGIEGRATRCPYHWIFRVGSESAHPTRLPDAVICGVVKKAEIDV